MRRSYRLATVRSCDEIFLIEDGRLAARGTFEQLRAEQPIFRDTVET